MKELSLYKIRDIALNSGIAVFDAQQLSQLIDKNKNIALVYMNRLVNNGLATRIVNGKISFIKDDFLIASQLISPSYISMNSALLYHNIIDQVPEYIECINTRNSINFPELGITYHKIKPELFFGYRRYEKAGSYIFVANPDKAFFDGLYFKIFSKQDIMDFRQDMDFTELMARLKDIKIRGIKKIMEMLK